MVVKAYYDNGHFDVFDTVGLVDDSAFRGSRLTNWSLEIGGEGPLLLNLYWYPNASAEAGPAGLPIAFRQDGWSFVIADEKDCEHLLKVTVDGEAVLLRAGGGFVDCCRFDHAVELANHFVPRGSRALAFLDGMRGDWAGGDPDEELARMLGMDPEAYSWLTDAAGAYPDEGDRFAAS
ncbi:MAG: hypothetical protein PUH18_04910 [Coriobacteriaceae bacterium]|nr:hypothetical protein [Coriobacteriaceae bacterium]